MGGEGSVYTMKILPQLTLCMGNFLPNTALFPLRGTAFHMDSEASVI